jgi:hypothetical protein
MACKGEDRDIANAVKRGISLPSTLYAFVFKDISSAKDFTTAIRRECFVVYSYLEYSTRLPPVVKVHEFCFALPTVLRTGASTIIVLVERDYTPIFSGYLRKNGLTVVGVNGVTQMVDVTIDSMNQALETVSLPLYCSGLSSDAISYSEAESVTKYVLQNEPAAFGHMVRSSIAMYCLRYDLDYVGLGDEHEAVDDMRNFGVKSVHYGFPRRTAFEGASPEKLSLLKEIRKRNILTVTSGLGQVAVAAFSVTDQMNDGKDVLSILSRKHNNCIVVAPVREYLVHCSADIIGRYGFSLQADGTLKTRTSTDYFTDTPLSSVEAAMKGWDFYTFNDWLVNVEYRKDGSRQQALSKMYRFSRASVFGRVYGFFVWRRSSALELTHGIPQIWVFSQTSRIRWLTAQIRIMRETDRDNLHAPRRMALKLLYPYSRVIVHRRVTGSIRLGKSVMWLAVSGHFMNTLLMSHFGDIGLKRYFDTLAFNVSLSIGKSKHALSVWRGCFKAGALAEDNQRKLAPERVWHNYQEYEVSILAYILMVLDVGMTPDHDLIAYSRSFLRALLKKYPDFDKVSGWQGAAFDLSKEEKEVKIEPDLQVDQVVLQKYWK